MTDTTRFENSLRRIVEASRLIQAKTTKPESPHLDLPTHDPAPNFSIDFPPIPDVSSKLRSVGITEHVLRKIVEAFQTKCNLLQTLICNWLSEMTSVSAPTTHPFLTSYVQKAYGENVSHMESEVYRFAASHLDKLQHSRSQPPTKSSFNAEFVPFLEKYFEFNAYPSTADRALMARKSMMTTRQIEVWFQNHRNRARKEGKSLARLDPSVPLPDLRLGLEEKMFDYIKPESENCSSDESDPENNLAEEEVHPAPENVSVSSNVLEPSSSAHAFPSTYIAPRFSFLRASIQECASAFSSVSLPWPRARTGSSPTASKLRALTQSQINEFSDLFARLTVRDGPRKVARRRGTPSQATENCSTARAAVCATTTVLCQGRHPSFVSVPCPPPSSLFSSTPATERRPLNQSIHPPPTGPSASPPSSRRRSRKSPQLPRRIPGSTPSSHARLQHMHHPYASPSRASSSSSSSSLSSCRTPSSSSESLSTPRTPDKSSTPLSFPTSTTKSTSIPSYSPWTSYFNLPNLGSPSPSPLQSNPSWFPQDLFLHNPFGVSALC